MCSHPGVLEGDYFLAIIYHHDGKINRYLLGEMLCKVPTWRDTT